MKITTLNSAFRTLCIAVMTVTATGASASIPLAGIYEMNDKEDMSKHQMYLELDFINSRPDFTQTFTTKRSEFKLLPSDFMRAKKSAANSRGQRLRGSANIATTCCFQVPKNFG